MAVLSGQGVALSTVNAQPVERPTTRITWDAACAQKGGYPHFMLKEIHEQPEAVAATVRGRVAEDGERVVLSDLGLSVDEIRGFRRIVLVAAGTSYNAGLAGRFMLEELAGLPTEVDISSEFRYRRLVLGPDTLVVAISQSGETADTLGAAKAAATLAAGLRISNVGPVPRCRASARHL